MGLFSSLFSGPAEDTRAENSAKEQTAAFPDLYDGMTITLLAEDSHPLLTGRLTAFTSSEMTLERLPGWFSFDVFDAGTTVVVRGYNKRMEPFNFTGKIQESSRIVCKLKELEVLPFTEQRYNFRLFTNCPATLYYQADVRREHPEECALVDISTGGACIESEYLHAEDEILQLKVKLEDYKPMDFLGQIIRVTEYTPGKFRYGFLFAQLEEQELTDLTRTLYNIQLGQKRSWSRSESGSWG